MSVEIILRNRQKRKTLSLPLLRRTINAIIEKNIADDIREIGIHIVSNVEMAQLNYQYLQHTGPTDVITFDYNESGEVRGDIFVCMDVAIKQAREFKTSWQSEVIRYIVHGILHLRGYDDKTSRLRDAMKAVENEWVNELEQQFDLRQLDKNRRASKLNA